ncbi:hypothetical protein AB0I89_24000 [Micromonospora sp. NPDC049801]|uniref:hypothetical protein n=1 Tax=unclassified Micromonospora TaxID=2617518 RepID=UPI0033D1CB9A
MADLTITDGRADILRAIDAGTITEDWHADEPATIRLGAQGHHWGAVVTGKVRVLKTAGLCETDPADEDFHVRGIRLTDAGRQALADYDARLAPEGK